jgi:hypothetical protein
VPTRAIVCVSPVSLADGASAATCSSAELLPLAILGQSAIVMVDAQAGYEYGKWYAIRNIPASSFVVTENAGDYQNLPPGNVAFGVAAGVGFDVSDLDPGMMSGAFACGFVIVATCWAIGKGARTVLSMLGK